jgi:hypothetical protein
MEKVPIWMTIPKQECHKCGRTDRLGTCNRCHKPVCPNCRWGYGDVSDGYQCLNCNHLEEDHAFHNLRSEVTKERNGFTRQARILVLLTGLMLSFAFWALVWCVLKDLCK